MKTEPIPLKEGMVFRCDTLRWNDGWEFDCPSMMLSPVIRCYETGAHHENIVENVMIDGVCDGVLKSEDFQRTWGWRGYNLSTLRRRFREALAGKKFPKVNYQAERSLIRIVLDKFGELAWEDV